VLVCRIERSYPTVTRHLNRLRLYSGSFLLCFSYGSSNLSVFLLGSSVFPLISLLFCSVPLFFLYFLCFFLSTLSTTYYLRIILWPLCLQSFTSLSILLKNTNLTTLVPSIILHDIYFYIIP